MEPISRPQVPRVISRHTQAAPTPTGPPRSTRTFRADPGMQKGHLHLLQPGRAELRGPRLALGGQGKRTERGQSAAGPGPCDGLPYPPHTPVASPSCPHATWQHLAAAADPPALRGPPPAAPGGRRRSFPRGLTQSSLQGIAAPGEASHHILGRLSPSPSCTAVHVGPICRGTALG